MAEPLDRLAELARSRDGALPEERDARERERFLEATRRPPTRLPVKPLVAAAAIVLAAIVLLVAWPRAALDLTVTGGELAQSGYLQAGEDGAALAFSDGSRVDLEPGSAGRVVAVTADGAELLLERGRATVKVTPRPGAAWSVAAGPYAVQVTGTAFDIAWSPDDETFELALEEGSVTIRGPLLDAPLALRAGKRVVARVRERDVQLRDLSEAPAARPAESAVGSAAEPAATVAPEAGPSSEPAATASPPAAAPSWAKLVSLGEYDRVLAEAEARGIESVLSGGSAGQLVALGDAARYRGRGALARRCLVALREHHAGHPAAASAAFLLGRMSEGAPAGAIRWYDRYLAEAPGGAYAAEALGRKLSLMAKSNPAGARGVAKQYLAAYPKGAYAALAKSLLR